MHVPLCSIDYDRWKGRANQHFDRYRAICCTSTGLACVKTEVGYTVLV